MKRANIGFLPGGNCSRRFVRWFFQARRWAGYLAALALCQFVTPADGAARDPLIVGSELSFAPFVLVREGGRPDGFAVELWHAVAGDARLNNQIETGLFHQNLTRFKNGEIDVLVNLAPTAERHGFAEFSVPHVKMRGAVFARKGARAINAEGDLGKV